jgi:Carboxypeptidase regulatory-like domain/Kelch motif
MLKPISTTACTAAGRLPRRLLAAAAVAAAAAGLLGAPPAAAALAAPSAPAAGHAATFPAKAVPPGTAASRPVPSKAAPVGLSAPPSAIRPAGSSSAKTPALPASQQRICPPAKPGYAACMAIARTTGVRAHRGLFAAGTAPSGYGPADLRSAYHLPAAGGSGETVAIVDAYDDPVAESDLAVYRQQYGLPACTTANGCFRKVAQDGSSRYPATDYGWAAEISLDLDMVSAACPRCHILLVEATDNSVQNLGAAVDEAVRLGAKYVSNSYGGPEDPQETSWDSAYYDHPGVAVVAATGYQGYAGGPSYPAVSPYVTAADGTTLTRDSGSARGWDESAWGSGGSGCSVYETKPAWQHDTGCGLRAVADVAAVADPSTGVAIYDSYAGYHDPNYRQIIGWGVLGGASAASPIITSVYALAGTPLPGTVPASYPYAGPSALNDITTGSNGTCNPAYLCTAGPGYDGPTGMGTPNGVAAFTLPHGDITGTVTSAAGTPLVGAVVQAGVGSAVTGPAGHYDLSVPAGSYKVTALDLSGYASQAATGVQVATGQNVTENFTLSPAASVTLSGTVTDGSGHGWPVYAKVTLAGTTDVAYTSPFTGRYTLKIPSGGTYTVQASPVYAGYQQAQQAVTAGTGNLTASLAVKANPITCTAAGYGQAASLSEPFNGTTAPPGWTAVTNGAPDATWQFGQPDGLPNQTPVGTGNYAAAVSPNPDSESADTALISPPVNLSHDPYPVLQFDYFDWNAGNNGGPPSNSNYFDNVDVSTDGGQTWTTVWSMSNYNIGVGGIATVAMPEVGGQPSVKLRFHYLYPADVYSFMKPAYWQINNVTVSGCQPSAGGLVAGRVTDGNTGQGVTGATVTAARQSVPTMAVPGDLGTGNGLYEFFSGQPGSQQVTASAPGYAAAAQDVSVTAGGLTRAAGFTLAAGRLAVAPGSVTGTAPVGGKTTATVTVRNTGTLPVTLRASGQPGGFTPLGETAAQAARGAPLQRISGHFAPLLPGGRKGQAIARPTAAPQPVAGSWVPISSPKYLSIGMAVAADPVTGRVYAAGGDTGKIPVTKTGQTILNQAAVLNPVTGEWSALPVMPVSRAYGQAAVIGGKLYVTGGVDNSTTAIPSMVVYNPATDKWSAAASPPHSYIDAAAAVLDGKMYVVGGCVVAIGECGAITVQVYHPATDTWTLAAPYPIAVSDLACGAISGKLYCAGGESDYAGSTTAAYVYDPASNAWIPIAPLPINLWGSAYTAANGQLLLSGGVTGNSTVATNQGFAYNPATGAWSALPNAPQANYLSAGACGFYAIGGYLKTYAEQLPGYGDCGGDTWLSAHPPAATIAPGQSATITVTLNAADPSVTQPGRYTATLELASDTPYGTRSIPVTLTATPPASWGQVHGTVAGKTCSGTTTPVVGATVQVSGAHGTWELTADTRGSYGLWLDTNNDPLTLIVSAPGYQSQAAVATITAGATTTRNFTLTPTTSCG